MYQYKPYDLHLHNMPANMMQFIVCVQCDPDPLLLENMALKSEDRRLEGLQWSVDKIKDDDTKTKILHWTA